MTRIPARLSHIGNAAMAIATGKFIAHIYVLQNGKLVAHEEVRKERDRYSDREGFFARRGRGETFETGSVYEDRQAEKVHKLFLKDMARHAKELSRDHTIDKLLIFAPAEEFEETKKAIPVSLRPKIYFEAKGNYHKRPIGDLLRMVHAALEAKQEASKTTIIKEEPGKILRRAAENRHIRKKRTY